jgi:hypothetical protein
VCSATKLKVHAACLKMPRIFDVIQWLKLF